MTDEKRCEKCRHWRQRFERSLLPCASPHCTPGRKLVALDSRYQQVFFERHAAYDPSLGTGLAAWVWAREGEGPDPQIAERWLLEDYEAREIARIRTSH
jgi:hypothetical protein